jgi:dihydroxy-acid dehydratase
VDFDDSGITVNPHPVAGLDDAARRIDLDVPAAELAARPAAPAVFPIDAKGYLGIYRRDVQAMATGAVLTDLGE